MKITKEEARRFILHCQLLDNLTSFSKRKQGAYEVVNRLGYLQIDTIRVVERSHHLVLRSRLKDYKPAYLWELLGQNKKIFEAWAHVASVVPMSDYRYYRETMLQFPTATSSWAKRWAAKNKKTIADVYNSIKERGPLSSADFKAPKKRKSGWWDWKPAKIALEYLWQNGKIMVASRKNFNKFYDLTERVLPQNIDTSQPSSVERKTFFVKRALSAMGIATLNQMGQYFIFTPYCLNIPGLRGKAGEKFMEQLLKQGILENISLEGLKDRFYILSQDVPLFKKIIKNVLPDNKVYLLSPFDNMLFDRKRTQQFFDFDFRLEAYVPLAKRQYGYFCMPILWQDRLIGRFDPKADSKKKVLFINALHIEQEGPDLDKAFPFLAKELSEFAQFNGCDYIEIKKCQPRAFKKAL